MDNLKERTVSLVPPEIPKKKIKKKSEAIVTYRGFVGSEVVEDYLLGTNWERDRGLLVLSKENYFFGLVYVTVDTTKEVYVYFPEVKYKDDEAVSAIQYRIKKVRLLREYFNAIQVDTLKEAEGLRGFVFCSPEAIEAGADIYRQTNQYDYSNRQESQQSEYNINGVEYDNYMRLKRVERKQIQVFNEGSIMVDSKTGETMKYTNGEWRSVKKQEKWKKKEEAERLLIF
jgi:hypothetical protein